MFTLCANYEELGLGEGYTVEAYSTDFEKLKNCAVDDAVRQGCNPDHLRWKKVNENIHILENLAFSDGNREDDDNYYAWVVIEFDEYFNPSNVVNVDAL